MKTMLCLFLVAVFFGGCFALWSTLLFCHTKDYSYVFGAFFGIGLAFTGLKSFLTILEGNVL